tara:strand:- start:44 stop:196 length:153 start_codon:yes stop_codon:yes gene_type:complete
LQGSDKYLEGLNKTIEEYASIISINEMTDLEAQTENLEDIYGFKLTGIKL